jgi:hypothetical protein
MNGDQNLDNLGLVAGVSNRTHLEDLLVDMGGVAKEVVILAGLWNIGEETQR